MRVLALLFLAYCIGGFGIGHADDPLPIVEPGGTAAATQMALDNPDEYAWQLFMYLNRPALPGYAGAVDPSKKFGDTSNQIPMVWETWALASGGPGASEVYKLNGAKPVLWKQLQRNGAQQLILDENLESEMVMRQNEKSSPMFFAPKPRDQEVRMNEATFMYIRDNQMYNIDGLEALQAKAAQVQNREFIQFPNGAKEIKAVWVKIGDSEKPRYLWREVTNADGTKQAYGLVSFHIITKDLPNWFWADFGHIDCEQQINACKIKGLLPTATTPEDSTTRGPDGGAGPSGKDGVRNEAVGTVWANYILRGTQTAFVTSDGRATTLSNPIIENQFQISSCISCHARAAVGPPLRDSNGSLSESINDLPPSNPQLNDPMLGPPDPILFGDSDAFNNNVIQYLQTDFLWSPIFRAGRQH